MKRHLIAAVGVIGFTVITGFVDVPLWAAGSYVLQSTFNLPPASIAGIDADSVGNVYVLGLASGAATYSVYGYQAQQINPLFSFDSGVTAPVAFAVEGSGNVDVIDVSNGITLKRFQNTGAFLGQAFFSLGTYISANALLSAAIDKANDRVYLAYQNFYQPICLQCLGCPCPTGGTKGYINQYDFQGNLRVSRIMRYRASWLTRTNQGKLPVRPCSLNPPHASNRRGENGLTKGPEASPRPETNEQAVI